MSMNRQWTPIGLLALIFLSCSAIGALADDRVLVIPKGTGTGYWECIERGALQAGKDLDIQVICRGPRSQDQREAQIRIIELGIRQSYDAIVLAPNHVEMADATLKKAVARGIKVILIDSGMNTRHHASVIQSDNTMAGQKAAAHTAALLDGKGEVAIVRYMANHASTQEREQGFLDVVSNKYPEMTVVAAPRMKASVGSAYHAVANLVEDTPAINAIFCVNGQATIGALRAIREKGLVGKLKVIGFDFNPTIREAILSREIAATILQNPFQIGYQGIKTAHALIHNRKVPKKILMETTLISADNYHSPEVQEIINANSTLPGDE
jgi:ribose transport system substrate-binding protein